MSKTQTFAKIVLVGVGLLTAIRVAPQLLTCLYMITQKQAMDRPVLIVIQAFVTIGCLALLFYFFWFRRDWLAAKVVGTETSSEPEVSAAWLPAAYRLVCMAAGLHCLYGVSFQVLQSLVRSAYAARLPDAVQVRPGVMDIATWTILLAAGLYLCWGAPHFVRWHMSKTLEQCRAVTDAG